MAKGKSGKKGGGESRGGKQTLESTPPVIEQSSEVKPEAVDLRQTERFKELASEYAAILANSDNLDAAIQEFKTRIEYEALVTKQDKEGKKMDETDVDATLQFVEDMEKQTLPPEIVEWGFAEYLSHQATKRLGELEKMTDAEFLSVLHERLADYLAIDDLNKRQEQGEISPDLAAKMIETAALNWRIEDLQKKPGDGGLLMKINEVLGIQLTEPAAATTPEIALSEPLPLADRGQTEKSRKKKKEKSEKKIESAPVDFREQLEALKFGLPTSTETNGSGVENNTESTESQFFTLENLSDVPLVNDQIEIDARIGADGAIELPGKTVTSQGQPRQRCQINFKVVEKLPGVSTNNQRLRFRVVRSPRPTVIDASDNNFETTVLLRLAPGTLEQYARVTPIGFIKHFNKGGYYILPDGGRLYRVSLPRFVDLQTGRLITGASGEPERYPEIDLTGFDGQEFYSGRLVSPESAGQYKMVEKILLHYLLPPRKFADPKKQEQFEEQYLAEMGWPGGLETGVDGKIDAAALVSDIKTKRMSSTAIAAMQEHIRRSSQEYPLPIVVSARGQRIMQGFGAISAEFQVRARSGDKDAKYMQVLAQAANAASEQLTKAVEKRVKLSLVEEQKLVGDYVRFFQELADYEQRHIREPRRIMREHFFPSDLDGETAVALFRRVGINNFVIPFAPDQTRLQNFTEYVIGATHIDISHGSGIAIQDRAVEGTAASETTRPVIFIDEDNNRFKSAAYATKVFLDQIGFLDIKNGAADRSLYRILEFIDVLDSYTGPYADKNTRQKIYQHYPTNIYGLAEQFVRYGRPDLVRAFFQDELPQIESRIGRPGRGRRDDYQKRFLDFLITYDASEFFKKVVPELYAEIAPRVAADKEKSDAVIDKLTATGFILNTKYGRALIDPFGAVKLRGLAAFANGFDVYVGYDWRFKVGTVLLSPDSTRQNNPAAILPEDFIVSATGEPKGSVVKDGKMFVMNKSSVDLTGLEEIIAALRDEATGELSTSLQEFIQLEKTRKAKRNRAGWLAYLAKYSPLERDRIAATAATATTDRTGTAADGLSGKEVENEEIVSIEEPKKEKQPKPSEISYARESYLIVHYIGKIEALPFAPETAVVRRELVDAVRQIETKIKNSAITFVERRAGQEVIKRAQEYMRTDLARLQNRLTYILSANIGRLRVVARGLGIGLREYLRHYVAHMVENTHLYVYFATLRIVAEDFQRDWVNKIISG